MERPEALQKLSELVGQDLRPLADKYGVTVWRDGYKNKGWAGHVIERHLGLPLNSSPSPNFGSWELKVIPLKKARDGSLRVKETMAITMLDPVEVLAKEFEQSHLFTKLQKLVVVSRVFESVEDTSSLLQAAAQFDLDNPYIHAQVKADYNTVRSALRTSGFSSLTGYMGVLVQPRTKGPGHGSISRAFYARPTFVAHIINLTRWPGLPPVMPDPAPEQPEDAG